jgi:hypothetical protein
MLNDELKFPEWQKPLQEVILEFDRENLAEKVQQVEALIFERLQQLRRGNDGHIEIRAINDALVVPARVNEFETSVHGI